MSIAKFQLVNTDYLSPAKYGGKMRISKVRTDRAEILKLTAKSFVCPDFNVTSGLMVMSEGVGVFNVKGYGAVGDGVTDDTAAIQKGLNYVSVRGGCLYFPKGVYGISSTLLLDTKPTSFSLCGDGWNSVIRNIGKNASVTMIQFTRCNGVLVKNLCIDGNRPNGADTLRCLFVSTSYNVTVDHVRLCNPRLMAMYDATYGLPRGTRMNNWIRNCLVEGGEQGLYFASISGFGVTGCTVRNVTGQAIFIIGWSDRCYISGCMVENTSSGVQLYDTSAAGGSQQVMVSDCIFTRVSTPVLIFNASCSVFSNIAIDMGEQGSEPIRIGGQTAALPASGNVMKNIIIKNITLNPYAVYMYGYTNGNIVQVDAMSDADQIRLARWQGGLNNKYDVIEVSSQRNLYTVGSLPSYQVGTGTECEFIFKGSTSMPQTANLWQGNTIEATSTTTLDFVPCFENIQATGANVPTFGPITLPTTGAIGSLSSYVFPSDALKEIYMTGIQMPNDWREASLIYPRAYFLLTDVPTALTTNIRLKLDYSITDVSEKIPIAATTLTLDLALASLGITSEGYLLVANLKSSGITMTGFTKACVINCRLYREVLTGSFYAGNMYLMGFGFHYNKRYIPGQ